MHRAAPPHAHSVPGGRGERTLTHTHTHTYGPLPAQKPTYPQVTFHSPAPSSCAPPPPLACLSPAAEKGHICLQTVLGRNQPVQNKDSRGCLHLRTRQPVAIFKLVRSPPSEGTLLCFSLSLSLLFACPATAQHTSIIHCLSPGFQAKPITDGVLLMGSCRTCQQAICAQATTLQRQ